MNPGYQFVPCKTYRTAYRRHPWAVIAAKVEGGFLAFRSMRDYWTWRAQR